MEKTIDDLPQEILEDIFHRLPIQTLGRCICVSKQWRFRIRNPIFVAANETIKRESNRFSILWHCDSDSFEMYTDDSSDKFEFCRYLDNLPLGIYRYAYEIASCNGLMCCLNKLDGNIILWNPVIRKMLTLPAPSYIHITTGFKDKQYLGLAFDSLANDYKLVLINQLDSVVEVFSLKTYSWKIVSRRALLYNDLMDPAVPILNGVLHWLNNHTSIVSFNVNTEVFEEIKSPQGLENNDLYLSAYEQSSSIAICCYDGNLNFTVWAMKEYGHVESWSKILKLDYDYIQSCWHGDIHYASIAGIRFKGEVLWKVSLKVSDEMDNDPNYSTLLTVSIDPRDGEKKYVGLAEECPGSPDVYIEHILNVSFEAKSRYFEESLMLLDNDSAVSIPIGRELISIA